MMSLTLVKKISFPNSALKVLLVTICAVSLTSCVTIVSKAGARAGNNLSKAILNSNDLETVKAGTPAYLILLDSLIQTEPDSSQLLVSAAQITNAYSSAFVDEEQRAKTFAEKSLGFAERAACVQNKALCNVRIQSYEAFQLAINDCPKKDINFLYTLGASWAGWIQSHSGDWNAVAQIARVQLIMEKVVELDEYHDNGGAHLYLGTLASILPPALGGKPDIGKKHFERAIELSEGKNLLIKTMYAELYARLVFDQDMHDQLLKEVLASNPEVLDLTLINTFAQKKAAELLAESPEYF